MTEVNTSKGHKKVLQALNKEIQHHEEILVELRDLKCKLIRIYERSKYVDEITDLRNQIEQLESEL